MDTPPLSDTAFWGTDRHRVTRWERRETADPFVLPLRRLRFALGDLDGPHNAIAIQADLRLDFQGGVWAIEAEGVQAQGPTLLRAVLAWLAVRLGEDRPA